MGYIEMRNSCKTDKMGEQKYMQTEMSASPLKKENLP